MVISGLVPQHTPRSVVGEPASIKTSPYKYALRYPGKTFPVFIKFIVLNQIVSPYTTLVAVLK